MPCRHRGCRGPCKESLGAAPTLSGICEVAASCPRERDKMPLARGWRQAPMPAEWRGVWTDGGAEWSTIFWDEPADFWECHVI